MKRKDVNETAFALLQKVTGAAPKESIQARKAEAAELGRKGGLKGGAARSAALTPEQRSKIAKKAAQARWKTKKQTEKG